MTNILLLLLLLFICDLNINNFLLLIITQYDFLSIISYNTTFKLSKIFKKNYVVIIIVYKLVFSFNLLRNKNVNINIHINILK